MLKSPKESLDLLFFFFFPVAWPVVTLHFPRQVLRLVSFHDYSIFLSYCSFQKHLPSLCLTHLLAACLPFSLKSLYLFIFFNSEHFLVPSSSPPPAYSPSPLCVHPTPTYSPLPFAYSCLSSSYRMLTQHVLFPKFPLKLKKKSVSSLLAASWASSFLGVSSAH